MLKMVAKYGPDPLNGSLDTVKVGKVLVAGQIVHLEPELVNPPFLRRCGYSTTVLLPMADICGYGEYLQN